MKPKPGSKQQMLKRPYKPKAGKQQRYGRIGDELTLCSSRARDVTRRSHSATMVDSAAGCCCSSVQLTDPGCAVGTQQSGFTTA